MLDSILIDSVLRIINANLLGLTLGATLLCFLLRDRKAALFSGVTFIFFISGTLLYPFLLEWDENFIYRYIVWACFDLSWMALIAYLSIKNKISHWQGLIGQLVVLPAPLLQLIRLVDKHYFSLDYSGYLYKTMLPIINVATVILCFIPIIYLVTDFVKNQQKLARDFKQQK